MAWFNVLMAGRQRLNSYDDYKETAELADSLDSTNDNESRIDSIKKYLAKHNLLNRVSKEGEHDTISDMMEFLDPENVKQVQDGVEEAYSIIDDVELNPNRFHIYSGILADIQLSQGSYIKTGKQEDVDAWDDDLMKSFFDSYNALKTSQHTARNICEFVYSNRLNRVKYANMLHENDLGDTGWVFEDVLIVPYILKSLSNEKAIGDKAKMEVYKVFSAEYNTDEDFLNDMAKYNPNNAYLKDDESGVKCEFDADKAKKIIESIKKTYTEEKMIGYSELRKNIDSEEFVKTKYDELYKIFHKTGFRMVDMKNILDDVIAYNCIGEAVITTAENVEEIMKIIDEALITLLNGYYKVIISINDSITTSNTILDEQLNIKNLQISLGECINRWKAFIASDILKWNGTKIGEACAKECKDKLLNDNSKYVVEVEKDTKTRVFNDKAENIIDVLRDIDTKNPMNTFDSLKKYIIEAYSKIEPTAVVKVKIVNSFYAYIKDFFLIDFDEKTKSLSMADITNKYFSAACNIVYKNDDAIAESLQSLEIAEFMMFESFVINEEVDYPSYFNKLASHIEKVMGDKGKENDAADYVFNYATYRGDMEANGDTAQVEPSETTDSSTGNAEQSEGQQNLVAAVKDVTTSAENCHVEVDREIFDDVFGSDEQK